MWIVCYDCGVKESSNMYCECGDSICDFETELEALNFYWEYLDGVATELLNKKLDIRNRVRELMPPKGCE
jgi:hypothetical protein